MNGKHKVNNSHTDDVDSKRSKIDDTSNTQGTSREQTQTPTAFKVYPKRNRTPSVKSIDCLIESVGRQKSNTPPPRKSDSSPRKRLSKSNLNVDTPKTLDIKIHVEKSSVVLKDSTDRIQLNSTNTADKTPTKICEEKPDTLSPQITKDKFPLLHSNGNKIQTNPVSTAGMTMNTTNLKKAQLNHETEGELPLLAPKNNTEARLNLSVATTITAEKLPSLDLKNCTEDQLSSTTAETTMVEKLPSLDPKNNTESQPILTSRMETTVEKLPLSDCKNNTEVELNSTTTTTATATVEKLPLSDPKNNTEVELNSTTTTATVEKLPLSDPKTNTETRLNSTAAVEKLPSDHRNNVEIRTNSTIEELPSLHPNNNKETQSNLTATTETTIVKKIPLSDPKNNTVAEPNSTTTTTTTAITIEKSTLSDPKNISVSQLHATTENLPLLNVNEGIQLNSATLTEVLPSLDSNDIIKDQLNQTCTKKLPSSNCNTITEVLLKPDTTTDKLQSLDFEESVELITLNYTVPIENLPESDDKSRKEKSQNSALYTETCSLPGNVFTEVKTDTGIEMQALPEFDLNMITEELPLDPASTIKKMDCQSAGEEIKSNSSLTSDTDTDTSENNLV